jgi:intracellular sulfur oxidation DsrE/DsrF family protein
MRRLRDIVSIAAAGAVVLLATTCLATAAEPDQPRAKTALATGKTTKTAKSAAAAQAQKSTVALAAQPAAAQKEHRLILQVNTNDAAAMNLALNNATNVAQYYEKIGEPVKIEVVTFGPGLNMLRDDTSPVKARIETMALSTPEVSFKACGITRENMRKAEDKDIPIVPQAEIVPSGVVRVMQLEEEGWSYVKP